MNFLPLPVLSTEKNGETGTAFLLSTQDTTELSSNILSAVEDVSDNVEDIATMSQAQDEIAGSLNDVVSKFKLN